MVACAAEEAPPPIQKLIPNSSPSIDCSIPSNWEEKTRGRLITSRGKTRTAAVAFAYKGYIGGPVNPFYQPTRDECNSFPISDSDLSIGAISASHTHFLLYEF